MEHVQGELQQRYSNSAGRSSVCISELTRGALSSPFDNVMVELNQRIACFCPRQNLERFGCLAGMNAGQLCRLG